MGKGLILLRLAQVESMAMCCPVQSDRVMLVEAEQVVWPAAPWKFITGTAEDEEVAMVGGVVSGPERSRDHPAKAKRSILLCADAKLPERSRDNPADAKHSILPCDASASQLSSAEQKVQEEVLRGDLKRLQAEHKDVTTRLKQAK